MGGWFTSSIGNYNIACPSFTESSAHLLSYLTPTYLINNLAPIYLITPIDVTTIE
jgi:hypothetical protein